ncbi:MAG: dihydroxyacetone kinase subunit L [Pseudomonadota bacterium]
MALDTPTLRQGLALIAAKTEASADELNTVDGALGDGDLGVTMTRGMREIMKVADDLPVDVGMALFACAQAFTRISGSSFGTLLATGLMSAAKACRGRTEVPWSEMSGLLAGAVQAMSARGKAELGQKTVLDPLDAAAKAASDRSDGPAVLGAIDRALDETMDAFRDQQAQVGRARIFAEKSVGLDDPGMVALRRVVDGLKAP